MCKQQDDMCQIINISRLRLVQSACSESNYQSWADIASAVIEESTAGTVDRRRTEDWLRDIADLGEEFIAPAPGMVPGMNSFSLPKRVTLTYCTPRSVQRCTILRDKSIFRVHERVPESTVAYSVFSTHLGTMVYDESSNFGYTPPYDYGSPWSLGRKICDTFYPGKDDYYDHRGERAYIYCPPCSCLVHTALSLCREVKSITNDNISIRVRPDARLTASCCYEENRSEWLEAIVEKSKEIEAKTNFKEFGRHLERPHITHLDRT